MPDKGLRNARFDLSQRHAAAASLLCRHIRRNPFLKPAAKSYTFGRQQDFPFKNICLRGVVHRLFLSSTARVAYAGVKQILKKILWQRVFFAVRQKRF